MNDARDLFIYDCVIVNDSGYCTTFERHNHHKLPSFFMINAKLMNG